MIITGMIQSPDGEPQPYCRVFAYRLDNGGLLAAGVTGHGGADIPGDGLFNSVSLLLTGEAVTLVDSSRHGRSIAVHGGVEISSEHMAYGAKSIYFPGDGWLSVAGDDAFPVGDQPWRMECGVYLGASGPVAACIAIDYNTSGTLWFGLVYGSPSVYAGGSLIIGSPISVPGNTFVSVAAAYNGESIVLQIDGQVVASRSYSFNLPVAQIISIGGGSSGAYSLVGWLDNVRITTGDARAMGDYSLGDFPAWEYIAALPLGCYQIETGSDATPFFIMAVTADSKYIAISAPMQPGDAPPLLVIGPPVPVPAPIPAPIPAPLAGSLLPPNATRLERALEDVIGARITALTAPLRALWSVYDCPAALLPALAWGLSVDEWDPLWGVDRQREIIASAIEHHRIKGTVGSVRSALATAGYPDAVITEGAVGWYYGADIAYGSHLVFGDSGDWAKYFVDVGRPITDEQAASVRRILAATAPARCQLGALSYTYAPWVYGDGCHYGSDLIFYGPGGLA